jgi:hypothetical protein
VDPIGCRDDGCADRVRGSAPLGGAMGEGYHTTTALLYFLHFQHGLCRPSSAPTPGMTDDSVMRCRDRQSHWV